MKRALIVSLLIAGIAACALLFVFQRVDGVVLKQREEAETTALLEAAGSAQKGRIPYDWSAAAFVPVDVLKQGAALTEGMKILVPPVNGVPSDLTLEVVGVNLSPDDGFAIADLTLIAKAPSKNVEVLIAASGLLRYLGEDSAKPAREGWRNLKFGVDLIEVRPGASIGLMQFKVHDLTRVLSSGVAASLGENCAVSVPVPTVVRADLQIDGREVCKAGDASIGLEWKTPTLRLSEKVEIAGPIFSKKGMWLLADQQPVGRLPFENPRLTRAEARKIVGDALAAAPLGNWRALVRLNRTVLEHLAASANAMNPTVSAKVTSVKGHLYHETWDFFGSGELKVDVDGIAGEGSVTIGPVVTAWKPNEGIEVTVPLTGEARVPIHIHLDPGPTGGEGFDVGIQGSTAPPISVTATLRPEIVSLANKKALILRVAGRPQKAGLEITTDGKFRCDVGTAHVAKVGATITAELNPEGVPPLLLFSEVPSFEKVAAEGIQLAKAGLEISAAPEKLSVTEDGLLLEASVRLVASNGEREYSATFAEVRQACRALAVGKPVGSMNIAILVAGLELSPRNDIVRFIGNAINDLTKGPGPGNEFVNAVNTVADDLTHGLGPNNDLRKWFRSPGRETEKFLSSSADKAAQVAEKGGKELEKLADKAANVAEKGGKELEKLGDKAAEEGKKVIEVIRDPRRLIP